MVIVIFCVLSCVDCNHLFDVCKECDVVYSGSITCDMQNFYTDVTFVCQAQLDEPVFTLNIFKKKQAQLQIDLTNLTELIHINVDNPQIRCKDLLQPIQMIIKLNNQICVS